MALLRLSVTAVVRVSIVGWMTAAMQARQGLGSLWLGGVVACSLCWRRVYPAMKRAGAATIVRFNIDLLKIMLQRQHRHRVIYKR